MQDSSPDSCTLIQLQDRSAALASECARLQELSDSASALVSGLQSSIAAELAQLKKNAQAAAAGGVSSSAASTPSLPSSDPLVLRKALLSAKAASEALHARLSTAVGARLKLSRSSTELGARASAVACLPEALRVAIDVQLSRCDLRDLKCQVI